MILGYLFLRGEQHLKEPKIVARFVNSRITPDLHTTPIGLVFDSDAKKPGWDEQKIDWEWFTEIQLANDSETPTTIEDVAVRARLKSKMWRKTPVAIEPLQISKTQQFDMGLDAKGKNLKVKDGPRYKDITSLMEQIRAVPLTKGIGYRGWLRFGIKQVNQRDMNNGRLDLEIWLVDALQGRHKVSFRKKDEELWDKAGYIFEND